MQKTHGILRDRKQGILALVTVGYIKPARPEQNLTRITDYVLEAVLGQRHGLLAALDAPLVGEHALGKRLGLEGGAREVHRPLV